MIERALTGRLLAALADTPVVTLIGGRQTGKSTLVTSLAGRGHSAEYVTLDDPTELAGARNDPVAFVERFAGPVVFDEIQRAPELLLPIKAAVDRDRRPGRFLLTGSANVLFVPSVAEALAGRMEVLTLWPFSTAEIEGRPGSGIVDLLFADQPRPPARELSVEKLVSRLLAGGYPEAVARKDSERRSQWFSSYLNTLLERDIRGMADIERLEQLPALLSAIALRTRGPLNKSGLSQDLGIPNSSIDRYVALLARVFLLRRLGAWHSSLGPRLVKAPKLLVSDVGLLCQLLRVDRGRLLEDDTLRGLVLESYVGMELVKGVGVAGGGSDVMHYRTTKGTEVDFLVEAADGRVVGIEVKGARSVDARDFRRFERLEQSLGERFVRGVVLYMGERAVTFGERLSAWPVGLV
ncbi:MAG TPA: ATP-binding protein [Solirubrobacterales bacterium]|nr:ATP-binding protein [Solirubrobacterales bacterium]